ncbi:MAG: NTP transferase domain-containing protein, partial [Pseudomonadota bacterium]
MKHSLVVLAAGQGTRMHSDLPKVLHAIAGAPMLVHALRSGAALDPERTVIVTGHGAEQVAAAARSWDETVETVVQADQLGTAHAVAQAREALSGFDGDVTVLYGDTPFIRPATLERMAETRSAGSDVVVLGFEAADPTGYGRLIVEDGELTRIVEQKDASPAEQAVTLCNSGVVSASAEHLFSLAAEVRNDNAKGEYY